MMDNNNYYQEKDDDTDPEMSNEYIDQTQLGPQSVGEWVLYDNGHEYRAGRIKHVKGGSNVFVVFHCDGDWDNFQDYTAESTPVEYLKWYI